MSKTLEREWRLRIRPRFEQILNSIRVELRHLAVTHDLPVTCDDEIDDHTDEEYCIGFTVYRGGEPITDVQITLLEEAVREGAGHRLAVDLEAGLSGLVADILRLCPNNYSTSLWCTRTQLQERIDLVMAEAEEFAGALVQKIQDGPEDEHTREEWGL